MPTLQYTYYEMLSFLTSQETPRKSKSNLGNGTGDVVSHRYYNTVYLCNNFTRYRVLLKHVWTTLYSKNNLITSSGAELQNGHIACYNTDCLIYNPIQLTKLEIRHSYAYLRPNNGKNVETGRKMRKKNGDEIFFLWRQSQIWIGLKNVRDF